MQSIIKPVAHLVLAIVALLQFNASAQAEVYRWVDEAGKVHFGDRQPEAVKDREKIEEISESLGRSNIDSSRKDREQLNNIFARESEQERQYDKKSKNSDYGNNSKRCEQARYELDMYDGRMALVDKNGNDLKLSEKDRKQRALQAREDVDSYCY